MRIKLSCLLLGIMTIAFAGFPASGKKAEQQTPSGEQVFKQYCANCHAGGDNKVNPNRPVAGSSKLVTEAIFKSYLSAPPGHMPYYQHVVNDNQLFESLYKYCKSLKQPTAKQACADQ